MILINLLPEEYRAQARTPFKVFAAVALIVAVDASLIAWWAWLAFGLSAEVESERVVRRDTMDSLQGQVEYHKALERESRQYESREATLAEITQNRVSWTRKVDELVDVINLGGGGQKYLIWLDDLTVTQKIDDRKGTFGSLKAAGHSGSGKFAQVANFLEDLENPEVSRFIDDFNSPAPPEGNQSKRDETLSPSEYWDFRLDVTLRPPVERGRADESGKEQAR